MPPRAWVAITDELIRALPDPEESFSRAGVKLVECGGRKVTGVRWWLIETDASTPAYKIRDGEVLPVTYGLGNSGEMQVTGPGGTFPCQPA